MNVLKYLYVICLFSLTVYEVTYLVEKYNSNKDTSEIRVQTFRKSQYEHFPAITICFYSNTGDDEDNGDGDGLYNNFNILEKVGMNKSFYRDIISGNIKDDVLLKRALENITFDMATIQLDKYLYKFRVQDNDHKQLMSWKQALFPHKNETKLPLSLFLSYQDPTFICYTYHTKHNVDVTVDSVDFYFYISKLQTIEEGQMYIYVHYQNQLIRHLRYLYKIHSFHGLKQEQSKNMVTLDLSFVSVTKRRQDANDQCDNSLRNDDEKWLQNALNRIGCLPPYWNKLATNSKVPDCRTSLQLKNASGYTALYNEKAVWSIFESYLPPCYQMRVMVNSNNNYYKRDEIFKLKFRLR